MKKPSQKIGILAFQGDVIEHEKIIHKIGHNPHKVLSPEDLEGCNALIIPGGESTTIGLFLEETGLNKKIIQAAQKGLPIFGTCAGAIMLAKTIVSPQTSPYLGLIDMIIQRNAYGQQVDSFHTDLQIPSFNIQDLQTAFIRAPIIQKVGPGVEVLAEHRHEIVLVRQKNVWAATFHPELRGDSRLHAIFLKQI